MTVVGSEEALSVELGHLRERLTERFGATLPPCMIGEMVDEAVRQFGGATVHQFVPLLVERAVTEQLRARAAAVPAG